MLQKQIILPEIKKIFGLMKKDKTSSYDYHNETWDSKYLKALTELMKVTGVTVPEIAKRINKTRQQVAIYLRQDNVDLDTYLSIFDSLGTKLIFSYSKPEIDNQNEIQITPDIQISDMSTEINNMHFVKVAMRKYGFTFADIAHELDYSVESVKRWFNTKVDTTSVKNIHRIAEAFGLTLNTKIRPKE